MANEVETKILGVDKARVISRLNNLGAEQIYEGRLIVDWFGPMGLTHNGDDPWFLRIRKYSNQKYEVTWKGQSNVLGTSRTHKEINFTISDPDSLADLFMELNLEKYAHQEKDRISWIFQNWRFDLDTYPNMPAYLEIEGKNEEHILEAIKLLDLQNHKTNSGGERVLIQSEYQLNWFEMKF